MFTILYKFIKQTWFLFEQMSQQYCQIFSSIFVENNLNIVVYPNPTIDQIQVKGFEANTSCEFILFDMNGLKVKKGNIENNSTIDLEDLSGGSYYLVLKNTKSSKKFLIIKT